MAMSKRQVAKKYGYKSGFEMETAEFLEGIGRFEGYETETIEFTQPEKVRKYTPDFAITKKCGGKMYIETKGRWLTDDRMKHRYIMASRPELDIRLVFMNPNVKISKGSKTTYATYCEKYGMKYSAVAKKVPAEWLEE